MCERLEVEKELELFGLDVFESELECVVFVFVKFEKYVVGL